MRRIHPSHGVENENTQYGYNYQTNYVKYFTPSLINKIHIVTKYIRSIAATKGKAQAICGISFKPTLSTKYKYLTHRPQQRHMHINKPLTQDNFHPHIVSKITMETY